MKATAELKMLSVSVLKPAAYNPRKKLKPGDKEYEKIKNSIMEFGFADPLVVNADMTIIGGHQRLTVAMELGYTEVPCAVVDIDKTREKALNIALNKITGAWDDSLLADLLKDIEDSNFDLGKTGFDPPEIETLFNKVHSKEVKEDDFDVESELKQPCFSKEGDLWHLGKHIVLCGDSTKAECYDTLMDGIKANLVLSDPPYNVDVEETAGKILNDNIGDSEFYQFLLAAFQQMHGHLADDGSIYIFHADTEGLNFRKAFKDAGFYLSGCCIWKKNALVLGRSPYGAFELHSRFDNFDKVFRLSIKGAWNYSMEVGKDPQGNILRVTNALAGIERALPQVERRLETLEQQLAQAREEAKRPFAQEAELAEKSARLAELNSLLNMDEKGSEDALGVDEDVTETEVADRPRQPVNYAGRVAERTADNVRKPSVLAQLHAKQAERTAEPQKSQKRKSHDMEL